MTDTMSMTELVTLGVQDGPMLFLGVGWVGILSRRKGKVSLCPRFCPVHQEGMNCFVWFPCLLASRRVQTMESHYRSLGKGEKRENRASNLHQLGV